MRDFTTDEAAGYSSRTLIPRDLIFVQPQAFDGSGRVDFGFWNGIGDVSLEVIDGITRETIARDFTSKGALLQISDIPVSDSLKVISAVVTLSQLNADAENAVRGYDMRLAPIQIYRALFSLSNPRALIAPARCRFAGYVNTAPISTPQEGGSASLALNCVGCTNELTRTNTELRSDESQQRRQSGDRFFRWVAATGQVQVFWGENKST